MEEAKIQAPKLEPVEHKTPFGPILGAEEVPIKKPKKK